MKNIVLLSLIVLLFACSQSDQNSTKPDTSEKAGLESKTEEKPTKKEDVISEIRTKFDIINKNITSYKVKDKELTGESTEGGELKSYYENENLKKVIVSHFGEMGKSVEEYYFSEGKVFFAFTQDYSYDKPMYIKGSAVKNIDENRYYFHGDKLVRWIDASKNQVATSGLKQKESEILSKIKALGILGSDSPNSIGHIDMRSLFSLSPLSIFDETTEGLSASEKEDLLKKGESASWKITEENATKLTLRCKHPSSEVALYFLKNKDNSNGILAAEVVNEEATNIQSWKYSSKDKTLQKVIILKEYGANAFVSEEDKLPAAYEPVLNYHFVDDQTIEVSLYTWMDKHFEDREVINRILLKWNGEEFEEKIEKTKR